MMLLKEDRIGQYAENAPGAIYWDEDDTRALRPLELVRRASGLHPVLFRPIFAKLDILKEESVKRIVARVPPGWMSGAARQFAVELICYNLKQLREIVL